MFALAIDLALAYLIGKHIRSWPLVVFLALIGGIASSVISNLLIWLFLRDSISVAEVTTRILGGFLWHALITTAVACGYRRQKSRTTNKLPRSAPPLDTTSKRARPLRQFALDPALRILAAVAGPCGLIVFLFFREPAALLTWYAIGVLTFVYVATFLCLTALAWWLVEKHEGWRRLTLLLALLAGPLGVYIAMHDSFHWENWPLFIGGFCAGAAALVLTLTGIRRVGAWLIQGFAASRTEDRPNKSLERTRDG